MTPTPRDAASPLDGVRVVVTRAAHQADELTERLAAAGATVARVPLLAVAPPHDSAPLRDAARRAADYDWIVFTSANAVGPFLDACPVQPSGVRAGAVGPATARALAARGWTIDHLATDRRGAGLGTELLDQLSPEARVLLPQAEDARPELAASLRAGGIAVDTVVVYAKRRPDGAAAALAALLADPSPLWVTVTSPRVARELVALVPRERLPSLRLISIGPTTSAALRALGRPPDAEAARPDAASLVAALVAALAAPSR